MESTKIQKKQYGKHKNTKETVSKAQKYKRNSMESTKTPKKQYGKHKNTKDTVWQLLTLTLELWQSLACLLFLRCYA